MKRLLALGALFLCSLFTFAQYSGSGNGTENDPYLIFNENQLAQISNFLDQEGVVFKLMKDLDLTNWIAENNPKQGWIPIGVETSPFKGVFNGNKHKITGMFINRSSNDNVGLFGYVSGVTINDLTIEGSTITGASNTGVLSGYAENSNITNCLIIMTGEYGVKGTSNVGGFIGNSIGTTCSVFSVTTSVNASSYAGGAVGSANSSTFSDGTVSGDITVLEDYAGGFFGNGGNIALTDINMTGNIIGQNYTGGIAGKGEGMTLTNINMTGDVSGQDYTGGMVGCCITGTLTTCNYFGNLKGHQYVGGIAGALENTTSTFTSCFSKGKIIATGDYVGGIVGVSQGACVEEMESCSHFGDISGQSYVGGLIGAVLNTVQEPTLHIYESRTRRDYSSGSHYNWYYETISTGNYDTKMVNNCTAIGNIIGTTYTGGLIGSETTANGYISNTIKTQVGEHYIFEGTTCLGMPLYLTYYTYTRNTISLSLTNNYYSGTLHGTDNVGGLVGYKSGGIIQNNYSYANIFGSSNVGGVAGYISEGKIDNSFNTTTIKSNVAINSTISATSSNIGRIYGYTDNDEYTIIGALASAEGNRALTQTKIVLSGVVQEVEDDLQNGTSIGPSALKLKGNYVSWGWNFDDNWNILETESYPYKKYQAAPPVIESNLVSKAFGISGKSINGGTVYLIYKDQDAVSTVCNGHNWSFSTEALQSGALVKVYSDVEGMTPSYFATTFVAYPGSGTEEDPFRIYTAEDLQGASNLGYYKLMNDVDLTAWISENSPAEGWPAIGRNSGEVTYIDGDNHKVTGLWMDTKENYNGLFSNFSAGQIKNLIVETAPGKKVKGGDYTGILIGRNAKGSIVNCTVKGDVEGTIHTGGVAGYVLSSAIREISFNGTVTSASDNVMIGGLAGLTEDCTISSCNVRSDISISGKYGKAGGLVGEPKGGSITTCFSDGSVSATGDSTFVGGLVGYALADIDNCYSTTKATGTLYTAGLVGYTFNKIDKCYAQGDVYGSRFGAGVVGKMEGIDAALTNSVACNNIILLSSESAYGTRVIGGYSDGAPDPDESNYALSTMQVSLNNDPQKKTDDLVEGKAMTLEVLQQQKTYMQLGWDFTTIWEIAEGEGYPTLQVGAAVDDGGGDDPDPVIVPSADDLLTAADVTAQAGKSTLMNINLTNKTTDLTAFQFELTLPQGVTLAQDAKGKYLVAKADRFEDGAQSLMVSMKGNNTYTIVCFSAENGKISGDTGALLIATVMLNGNLVEGSFEGKISNVEFTRVNGTKLKLDNTKFTISVKNTLKGDANGDGEISVTDVVEIVNYIMGNPSSKFVMSAADVNDDGDISVTDIVLVVSMILSDDTNYARMADYADASTENDRLILTGNNDHSLSLCLDNASAYLAAQFELRLSDGQSLNDIRLNPDRCDGLNLIYFRKSDNCYQVMLYSLDNQPIDGHSGELMNISVAGYGNVVVDRALFVTIGKTEKRFTSLDGGTTGITVTKELHSADIYGLDGRLVRQQANDLSGLAKGVYIINGKKYVVK